MHLILALALLLQTATPHNAVISWQDAEAGATFNVYRAPLCSGTFAKVNAAPITTLAYTDTPLSVGTYCYQVTAVVNGQESKPSSQVVAAILPFSPNTITIVVQ